MGRTGGGAANAPPLVSIEPRVTWGVAAHAAQRINQG